MLNCYTIDIETYDPYLLELGSGVFNKTGYVVGAGIRLNDGTLKYLPFGAEDITLEEKQRYLNEFRKYCETPIPKLFCNSQYDLSFIQYQLGIQVNGDIYDVQIAEPLIDQYMDSYSLNTLCQKYNIPCKKESVLVDEENRIKERIRDKKKHSVQYYIKWMPSTLVGEYCTWDCEATYRIHEQQLQLLAKENLLDLYTMERELIPLLLQMRKNGIRIDQKRRVKTIDELYAQEQSILNEVYAETGQFNFNSSRQLASVLEARGLTVDRTEKGAKSVTKETLQRLASQDAICDKIMRVKNINKLRTSFVEKAIDDNICPDGRLHAEFLQLKRDEGGTITGRFSCQHPNLQQIPRNDKQLGALCRGLFIPDENCWYGKTDFSQIEYRLFVHYARGYTPTDMASIQAEEVRQKFRDDPSTDYHQFVIDVIKEIWGIELDRPTAKRINFGTLYFMGVATLVRKFGMDFDHAQKVYNALFKAVPFILPTREYIVGVAKRRGYTKTILGRHQRLSKFHIDNKKEYALFNYTIQGSAADIAKSALLQCYKAGVYDVLPLHLIVHDETGVSIPKTKEGVEAFKEQEHIMCNAVKLKVPVLAEAEAGNNWGELFDIKESIFDYLTSQITRS